MKRLIIIYFAVYIISNVLFAQAIRIKTSQQTNILIDSELFRTNDKVFNTNDIGKITQEVWQKWSETTFQYNNDEKFIYKYDKTTNNLIEYIHQKWEDGQWLNHKQTVFNYDINGLINTYEEFEWKNNKWRQIGIGEYSDYDVNGNYGEESYSEVRNGIFEYRDKFVYTYDSSNNIIEKYSYAYNDDDWVPFNYYQFVFDGNCQISQTSSSWDGSKFIMIDRLEFQYDSGCFAPIPFSDFWWFYNGSPTSWTYSVWDGSNWVPGYHGEYIVNNCGWTTSGTLYDTFNPTTLTWEGETSQGIIGYNQNCDFPQPDLNDVRIISAEYKEYQNGTWVNSDRTLISYEGLLLNTKDDKDVINEFRLKQNYPNPFNPSTIIEYSVPEKNTEQIQLIVYDILGNEIVTLVNGVHTSGDYSVEFNTEALSPLPNGIYYYKLKIGDRGIIKKMMLVK